MITEAPPKISTILPPRTSTFTSLCLWGLVCLLLAWVQIGWAGYQLGVGNQAIQISFLQSLHNPDLFRRDIMVQSTLSQYPSLYPQIGARLLYWINLPQLFLTLHLCATVGVLMAVVGLTRAITKNASAGLVAILILLAGHHQSLAGEMLYSTGFTHTWLVFPLCLLALMLFYRESYWGAFALTGAIFNLHALESAYILAILGFVSLCQIRSIGWRKVPTLLAVFLLTASPALIMMLTNQRGAIFDDAWLKLMHIRSADHSFPSSWWQAGTSDIPRFVSILGLACLAFSFHLPPNARRKTILAAVALAILFVIGYLFTEVYPHPLFIRAQLFRSSRMLLILALILIAHGCVCGWRMPWHRPARISKLGSWLEFASATLIFATLAIQPLLVLLPATLAFAALIAIFNGRMSWYQAFLTGAALLVCLAAWHSIQFLIPGLSREVTWRILLDWRTPAPWAWMLLAGALALTYLTFRPLPRRLQTLIILTGLLGFSVITAQLFPHFLRQLPSDPANAAWIDAQRWASTHTPVDALFLTPAQQSSFRVHSQRAVVGEWRDGTQLYFNPAFAQPWWEIMNALQPGMVPDIEGKNLLSRGRSILQFSDAELITLAQHYHADFIVVPPSESRLLVKVYDNNHWAIYQPKLAPPPKEPTNDPLTMQDVFYRKVIRPNIEKNRKSDLRIQILDSVGRPVDSVKYQLTQKTSSFAVGCSLPFFKVPDVDTHLDYKPPAVSPAELSRFPEIFNYSLIPFSGQWQYIESREGKRDYSDLDQYVDWCSKNGVRTELKFLTGFQPPWFKEKNTEAQNKLLLAHATDLVTRYGNRIDSWQLINERVGLDQAVTITKEIRKIAPKIRLGLGEDARLWSPRKGPDRDNDMLRGLDQIRTLKKQGVQMDFIAFQGHRPLGLWADGKEMYDIFDAFAKEGVRVHVTELGVPLGARIEGPVTQGQWTPQLQADYYTRVLNICFSHANVEAVNIYSLGSKTWLEGEGLLDNQGNPTPAYNAVKKLVTQDWRTNLTGTLGLDGVITTRAFHGSYELSLTLPSGQTCQVPLTIVPNQSNTYRFKLDLKTNQLSEMKN